ncbi:MAG: acyl-CoA thioesterase, partial [Verrucomicrobiae bacterium]|nr:acyl-CoA thioesterase [Verrucomicrobiae bacterium]
PVLGVNMKYKKPAFFDDSVKVICLVKEAPSLRFHIDYEIYREETLLALGSTDHAFINREGRPVRPDKEFVRLFSERLPVKTDRD